MGTALRWADLSPAWQACLEEAWAAYLADNVPIGAVVTDDDGEIKPGATTSTDLSAPPGQRCSATSWRTPN